MYIMGREVKALKDVATPASSDMHRMKARNLLGETFGSKKALKAIRAAERNKVDVSAMQGVASHLQESIQANTSSLPSQGAKDLSFTWAEKLIIFSLRHRGSEGYCR